MADGNEAAPGDETPEEEPSKKHNQAFFLDLAANGKEAWNAWRREPANKDVRVIFAGVDFSGMPRDRIDFSGFEFGDRADFSRCGWQGAYHLAFARDRARFTGAVFGNVADFTGAMFGNVADFKGAIFGSSANFTGAVFGNVADFKGAIFGSYANFTGVTFDNGNFTSATFDGQAIFTGVSFGGTAKFTGATFGGIAYFSQAHFKGRVEFVGKTEEQWTRDIASANTMLGMEVQAALKRRHEESWLRYGSGPDRFLDISFARARFDGVATFSGRSFEHIADFTNSHFYSPPNFDNVTNASRIDFTRAHIGFAPRGKPLHWTELSRIPILLRTLRKIAEETKNHDLERDLYVEERKAERGVNWRQLLDELRNAPEELKKNLKDIDEQQREVWSNWRHRVRAHIANVFGIAVKIARLFTHLFWIAVISAYWALADYGRSFARPLAWLFVSVFIFHFGYALILAPLKQKVDPANKDYYDQAVWMLALGNAVPFVGHLSIDAGIKDSLYCPGDVCGERSPIPPLGVQVLVIVQNVVSIALIFFFGLALRNYFKIK
jgi:uncharacterized protein YjbI with pentapeptide repeats